MQLLKKAYKCRCKFSETWFYQIIYAESRGQAKSKHVSSYYDDATFLTTVATRQKNEDLYFFDGKEMTLSDINYKIQWINWRHLNEKKVSDNPNAKVYIWSGQWNAYWRDNGSGYTTNENIGVYDIQDAWSKICSCGLEKQLYLQIIK